MRTFSNHHYNTNLKEFAQELRSELSTKAERRLWKSKLCRKQSEFRFIRQRSIDRFIVDFFSPELGLIIEIDGNSHYHKPEYDAYRQKRLESFGYTVLRFSEGMVLNQLEEVCVQIDHAVFSLRGMK